MTSIPVEYGLLLAGILFMLGLISVLFGAKGQSVEALVGL